MMRKNEGKEKSKAHDSGGKGQRLLDHSLQPGTKPKIPAPHHLWASHSTMHVLLPSSAGVRKSPFCSLSSASDRELYMDLNVPAVLHDLNKGCITMHVSPLVCSEGSLSVTVMHRQADLIKAV